MLTLGREHLSKRWCVVKSGPVRREMKIPSPKRPLHRDVLLILIPPSQGDEWMLG